MVGENLCFFNFQQEPSEQAFDIKSVSMEVKTQPLTEKKAPGKMPMGLGGPPKGPDSACGAYEKLISSIPEFSSFGKLFNVKICILLGYCLPIC